MRATALGGASQMDADLEKGKGPASISDLILPSTIGILLLLLLDKRATMANIPSG
jgi:hypothetical protein